MAEFAEIERPLRAPRREEALTPEARRTNKVAKELRQNLIRYTFLTTGEINNFVEEIKSYPESVFKYMPTMAGALVLLKQMEAIAETTRQPPILEFNNQRLIRDKSEVLDNLIDPILTEPEVSKQRYAHEMDLLRYISFLTGKRERPPSIT